MSSAPHLNKNKSSLNPHCSLIILAIPSAYSRSEYVHNATAYLSWLALKKRNNSHKYGRKNTT